MPPHRKILCFENQTAHSVVNHLLSGVGYDFELCSEREILLEKIHEFRPSAVILGVNPSNPYFIQICHELRARHSAISFPILLLANEEDGSLVTAGLEAGANDYLLRNGNPEQQRMRVRNYLSLVEQQEEMQRVKDSMAQMIRVQNALCDVLPHGIVVHDRAGAIIHYNQVLKEWCRGKVPETFLGLGESLCDGALTELIESQWADVKDSSRSVDALVNTRHFVFRNISVTSCPIQANLDRELRLWTFKDVTDSRELELKRDVDVAIESVSTFVHGVAHNFNNILASVLGSASLLARQEIRDPRAKACVSAIRKSAEAGAALTRKMMVMVRDPISGDDVEFENVRSVLELISETFHEQFGDRIIFQLDADEELPSIRVNVRNLADIFSNIVANSVDSIVDTGWILIRARFRKPLDSIEVTISDNGKGMDEKTLRRLFEPFFTTKNLDMNHQVSRTGNGLGMWNVYNLVRLLGGDIQVESSPNEGTRVLVTLPAASIETRDIVPQIPGPIES